MIRRLDGLLQGDYRSLFYGYGVDFADLREYQPEDDIRYIDWNVTARMDTPYVRQYVEDREITAWFLVDLSPSMDFGTVAGREARGADRPGGHAGAPADPPRQPGGGDPVQRAAAAAEAAAGSPRRARHPGQRRPEPGAVADQRPAQAAAPAQGCLHRPESHARRRAVDSIKKRSLVFVLSDFISAPGWERTLSLLKQRHEVLAIRLWDPREVELPDVGPVWMEDAETGEQLYVDTHDPQLPSPVLPS